MHSPSTGGLEAGISMDAGASEAIVMREAGSETSTPSVDAAVCFIEAANYDRSCSTDTDCVDRVAVPGQPEDFFIQFGNYCTSICVYCGGNGTISKNAVAQYVADVSKTPLGLGEVSVGICSCKAVLAPKCMNGSCVGF